MKKLSLLVDNDDKIDLHEGSFGLQSKCRSLSNERESNNRPSVSTLTRFPHLILERSDLILIV